MHSLLHDRSHALAQALHLGRVVLSAMGPSPMECLFQRRQSLVRDAGLPLQEVQKRRSGQVPGAAAHQGGGYGLTIQMGRDGFVVYCRGVYCVLCYVMGVVLAACRAFM